MKNILHDLSIFFTENIEIKARCNYEFRCLCYNGYCANIKVQIIKKPSKKLGFFRMYFLIGKKNHLNSSYLLKVQGQG